MPLFEPEERNVAVAISHLNDVNPFTRERVQCEQEIVGAKWGRGDIWHNSGEDMLNERILKTILGRCVELVDSGRRRLTAAEAEPPSLSDMQLYDRLVIYWLFETYRPRFYAVMEGAPAQMSFPFYKEFETDFRSHIEWPGRPVSSDFSSEKCFATFYQIHRAFSNIFDFVAGGSEEAAQLRASVWNSIFTYDIYRYYRLLYKKMNLITTLITGESGTGKELVARAIALSQYIPFDPKGQCFVQSNVESFKALQLSAMPQSMIEAELYGYRKGAFTGALEDHKGYFETCTPHDSIFLDEIGEINAEVQVKLLRVVQNRSFQRLGDVHPLPFQGKILAATNRDLHKACQEGLFRRDLYYRLCADTIETVPLRKLLHGSAKELRQFIVILARRLFEDASEGDAFAEEASSWIESHLGLEYGWPGNVRELGQCLRNLLVRGSYVPATTEDKPEASPMAEPMDRRTAAEVLRQYMKNVYEREGRNLAKTARAAGVDRRTAKKYLELN